MRVCIDVHRDKLTHEQTHALKHQQLVFKRLRPCCTDQDLMHMHAHKCVRVAHACEFVLFIRSERDGRRRLRAVGNFQEALWVGFGVQDSRLRVNKLELELDSGFS